MDDPRQEVWLRVYVKNVEIAGIMSSAQRKHFAEHIPNIAKQAVEHFDKMFYGTAAGKCHFCGYEFKHNDTIYNNELQHDICGKCKGEKI